MVRFVKIRCVTNPNRRTNTDRADIYFASDIMAVGRFLQCPHFQLLLIKFVTFIYPPPPRPKNLSIIERYCSFIYIAKLSFPTLLNNEQIGVYLKFK